MKKRILFVISLFVSVWTCAQTDTISSEHKLGEVVVKASNGTKSRFRVDNVDNIGQQQLIRAACCNLGESFTTNPSVDVSYSDAATGARQIKLLGLSGTYVQMLTENVPNLRGASIPYSLGYVPGPWMQSIQVSKGASSVKNGYESTTGQINIEFLKPQATDGFRANAYLDSKLKYELNADGSIHLTDRLSTSLLLHYEDRQTTHDGNGDGFMDMPQQRQYNIMHRWAYVSPRWISQLSLRLLRDDRHSGQHPHHVSPHPHYNQLYTIDTRNDRYEFQWKNGLTLNADRNRSVALMLHGSIHDATNTFGHRRYDVQQRNFYAQLMYETDYGEHHNLALGSSFNFDRYQEYSDLLQLYGTVMPPAYTKTDNGSAGIYAQYTYKLGEKLTVMAGMRLDGRNLQDNEPHISNAKLDMFLTPRLHVKFTPWECLTLRASAGKGYRKAHALAENVSLLAMQRYFVFRGYGRNFNDTFWEEAWNYGLSAALNIPIAGRNLELNAEYYYTNFLRQMVVNIGGKNGPNTICFEPLNGKSYSHTLQIDATYPFFRGFTATGAFRINDVRTTYDGVLRRRPLTSFYKGLLTLSYKTPLELWHFDLTAQLSGKGEMYDHTEYPAYVQLQAQVTRDFRHFSIYLGGENLTNYRMPTPILGADNPWNYGFDATQVWGPTDGIMAYLGIRLKF